jgi:RimJ/RimL family protein N-acetyltransferase
VPDPSVTPPPGPPATPAGPVVTLRPVEDADLPILYAHQADPEAAAMAAMPSRERAAFDEHWARIRLAPATMIRTVLAGGIVAGNVLAWRADDGATLVGYWIGREQWGRGVASAALAAFLEELSTRPLWATVALDNPASRRVLAKCGFVATGPAVVGDDGVAEVRLRLG